MHELTVDAVERSEADDGFTLVELIVTISIVGIILVALVGVVIGFLKTTVATSARLTESNAIQFAAAYWQRDVASIGVRSTIYCQSLATDPSCTNASLHSFPLLQSVNVSPACPMPAPPTGASWTTVVTLAWSQYTTGSASNPATVTVTYLAAPVSAGNWTMTRVRCVGSTMNSTALISQNLTGAPTVACPGAANGCGGSGDNVPTVVTMTLTSSDTINNNGTTYQATLRGERRET